MASEALGVLKLNQDSRYHAALNHLQDFSHIWLIFTFHKHVEKDWHPIIEPPKLDAPTDIGVFASRSPHRPNPIGLSVVKLERIDFHAEGGIEIHVSGVDILDGTPVLDIKPYLPYADRIPEATSGWATGEIEKYPVEFSNKSLEILKSIPNAKHPNAKQLITQMLERDPRPTAQRKSLPLLSPETEGITFAFRVLELDVRWKMRKGVMYVEEIVRLS